MPAKFAVCVLSMAPLLSSFVWLLLFFSLSLSERGCARVEGACACRSHVLLKVARVTSHLQRE